METNVHFLSYLARFFLKLYVFQTEVVEKFRTHIFCSVTFLGNYNIYEIIWKNIV
jgi:hypothetical protein